MKVFDEHVFDDESYKLVVSIVQRGYSDEVIFAAKSAGAKGGVVLSGKGAGSSEKKFFGFKIDPENEIVLILAREEIVVPIMKAIYQATDYQSAARGMVFCLPVSYVTGMTHVKLEEEEKERSEEKNERAQTQNIEQIVKSVRKK